MKDSIKKIIREHGTNYLKACEELDKIMPDVKAETEKKTVKKKTVKK